jgi:hypothetical protein
MVIRDVCMTSDIAVFLSVVFLEIILPHRENHHRKAFTTGTRCFVADWIIYQTRKPSISGPGAFLASQDFRKSCYSPCKHGHFQQNNILDSLTLCLLHATIRTIVSPIRAQPGQPGAAKPTGPRARAAGLPKRGCGWGRTFEFDARCRLSWSRVFAVLRGRG